MNIIKDYINEVISFIKDEEKMDILDYLVYLGILLGITFYLKRTQPQICFLNFNLQVALRLGKIVLILLISSTLIFNLYRLIRKKI